MSTTMVDTNVFGVARDVLWNALAGVLPDRVYAYAPAPVAAPVAPAVWIARDDSYLDGPTLWVSYTVVAVSDGADHAAQAMLDEIKSAIWSAAAADPAMRYQTHTSATLDVSPDVTLRACEFVIDVACGAHSWCPPAPHTALIPPTVINGGP